MSQTGLGLAASRNGETPCTFIAMPTMMDGYKPSQQWLLSILKLTSLCISSFSTVVFLSFSFLYRMNEAWSTNSKSIQSSTTMIEDNGGDPRCPCFRAWSSWCCWWVGRWQVHGILRRFPTATNWLPSLRQFTACRQQFEAERRSMKSWLLGITKNESCDS